MNRLASCLFGAMALVVLLDCPADAQTTVRVGKPQAGTFQFIPIDIGIETGIFKKHGLDVQSSDFGGGPRVQQALTAGALDIAIGSGPELAMIVKGAPEIAIAAIGDAPYPVVLAVRKDGPKTIADLKGKKVSISSRGSLTYWLGQQLSRLQGWGTDGINLTPLGTTTAQTAALRTSQIDGMIVAVNAGYRLEEDGSGRILVRFGDIIKTFHIYVLYAHKDFAAKNPEAVRAFLAGWFETVNFMRANRDKTIEIVARKTAVSKAIATRAYDEMMGLYNLSGKFNPEALKVLSRSFIEMGTLPNEPDMSKLVSERFLPGAK